MKNRIPAIAGLAVAASLALAGCTATAPEPADTSDHGGSHGSSNTSTPAAEFNDADVMFASMMIPHHEQAIEMSDIMLNKEGVEPQVAELAQEIKDAQGPEIELQQAWLKEWGADDSMDGMDHGGMDGMLSEEELSELEAADGPAASKLFLEQMIAHHEGAVEMAETEVAEGKNPDALALAQEIIDAQNAEIDRMKSLLETI